MEKQYLQFDINDERAGLIAEVLANKTCKRILSLLSEKDMSESDISRELKIPANTAHYNIQKLVSSGLVEATSRLFWSAKGKRMVLYKLSNKKVIISPKTSFKGVLPAIVATGIVAIGVKIFSSGNEITNIVASDFSNTLVAARDIVAVKSAESATLYGNAAMGTAASTQAATDAIIQAGSLGAIEPWSWFLLGAWAALLIFVLFNMRRNSSN